MLRGLFDRPLGEGHLSALSTPREPLALLANICDLCAGSVADFCSIYLHGHGAAPAAFACADEARWGGARTAALSALLEDPLAVIGQSTLSTEPLTVGGRAIGTFVLGSERRHAGAASDSPHVAGVLTTLISMALEQSQQLAHHYHVSQRLQQALLPDRLMRVEGLSFDAAYRPASDEAEVGGDWYDAFEIGNGMIGVSVGDVTGHGLEAAVSMSQIARAIRSAAPGTNSPTALLNYVDGVVTSQGLGMATAIVGIYDPQSKILRYASAGHPHPVLLSPSGKTFVLPAGGLLLGLGMTPASPEWTVTLTPGTTCYLYTDGLLEYRRDIIEGERELLVTLERLARDGPPSADGLHEAIFQTIANTDDVATLALHNASESHVDGHWVYSSLPSSAGIAREALRNALATVHSQEFTDDAICAAGEAIANAIEHGSDAAGACFEVDYLKGPDASHVTITSKGHWKAFTPRPERGRGIPIMRACSSNFEVASTAQSTKVTLTLSHKRPL